MRTPRNHRLILNSLLVALLSVWQIAQPLQAATINWTAGSAANFNWATATNWSTGVPTALDDVIFQTPVLNPGSLSNPSTITLATGSLANTLWLSDNYTLSGGDLTLTNGGIRVDAGMVGVISSKLQGNNGITKLGTGTLTLSGANTFTGGLNVKEGTVLGSTNSTAFGVATGTITLGDSSANSAAVTLRGDGRTFAQPIVLASGTTGTITLGATSTTAATFSGGVTGTNNLVFNSPGGAFPLTLSTATVNPLGSLTNANTGTGLVTISSVIGPLVTGLIQNSSTSNMTLSGANTFNNAAIVVKAGTLTNNNATGLGGSGNTITIGDVSGSANATLSIISTATYAQPITIAGGNTGVATIFGGTSTGTITMPNVITLDSHDLTLSKSGTTGNFLISGNIVGTGDLTFNNIVTSTGLITLSGFNNYTGKTTFTAGVTVIAKQTALYLNNTYDWTASNIQVNSGATLGFNVGGTGEFTASNINSLIALGTASGGFMNGSFIGFDTTNAVGSHFIYESDIQNSNAGANSLGIVKLGTGTLTLAGDNTYTGRTIITAGALAGAISESNLLLNGGVYESSGTFTRSLGTGDGQVQWAASTNGGFSARGGPLTVTLSSASSPLIWDSTANFVSGTGQLLFGSVTSDNVVTLINDLNLNSTGSLVTRTIQVLDNTSTTADKTVFSGVLSSSSAGVTLTKTGAGVLELTGANTFTGTVAVSAGTLIVSSIGTTGTTQSNLGAGSGTISLGSGTTTSGTLTYTGVGETTVRALSLAATTTGAAILNSSGSGALVWQGNVTSLGTTKTFTLGGSYTGSANIFSGTINMGTGHLTKAEAGTWILTAANTFVNTTIGAAAVGGGTLRLEGAGTIGSGTLTITGGALEIAGSANQAVTTLTMGGSTVGSAATIDIGTGRSLSATAITYTGTASPTAIINGLGTLNLGSAGITVTVADNTANAVDMTWSMDTLTGSGAFIKAGAGTLDISGITTNSFTGSYQINAGAVLGLSLVSNNLILNGGVYEGSGTFTRSLGTGNNQVQWLGTGGGGFSATGGNLTVTLAGAPSSLIWGSTTNFVADGAPLIFGSTTADSEVTFTHDIDLNNAARTVQVLDNTLQTSDKAILSGVISNGSLVKTGAGILELTGVNTFTGGLTINGSGGMVQFTTAENLGGLNNAISLQAGFLSFIGSADLTLSNPITLNPTTTAQTSGLQNLGANGTAGATINFSGLITTGGNNLTLTGTGKGSITGGIVQTGGAADLNVNSGTWDFSGTPSSFTDDVLNTGPTVVVNLNSTGIFTWGTGASTTPNFYLRSGATANLNVDDAITFNSGASLIISDASGTAAISTLNMGTHNLTVPILTLGGVADVYEGVITGSGNLTVGTTITLSRGSIAANLAGAGAITKSGLGTVTLSGDNSGLTGTTSVAVNAGNLILDYSTSNAVKLRELTGLSMTGGMLTVNGGVLANTVQAVASLAPSSGANTIEVDSLGTFTTTFNVAAITRANGAGTMRFLTSSNGSILTTTINNATTGLLGTTGTAFATINDGTGTYFAINNGSDKIVALTYAAAKNDVTSWVAGDHVTSSGTGFTSATINSISINSLRFDAPVASTLNVDPMSTLTIASGGILQTDNVAGGASVISGGRLVSGTGELVITTDSVNSDFEISSYLSGTTILTKTGPGTLILSASNFYSGATNIQNGEIYAMGGNAIGDRSTVTLADDHNSMLKIFDNETIGSLAGGSATSGLNTLAVVDIGANALTINEISASTYSGVITGTGTLIKTGATTLTLAGASTNFTGDLIINQGQISLTDQSVANFTNVKSVTVNGGVLLLSFTGGTTTSPNKINNSAPITLINTGGLDGLRANNDRNDASKAETIGVLTLLGGANTVTLQESAAVGTTARQMTITASSIVRSNRATLLVRGNNLGDLALNGVINSGRFVATTIPTLTGGAGAVNTTSISILPWAIGETTGTALTTYGTGNSFVTAVATTGFRPLDLTTEYEQLGAAGGVTVTNNVRFSSASSLTLDGAAKTMNALLVDNTSTTSNITLGGANAALNVNSGAFLFTGTQPIVLSGFSGITTGSLNEYILHVSNTATAGVTIASPFKTGTAALTKSGAGTLILAATGSTYAGPTTINQGILQIDSLDKLGNMGSGGLFISGGTLRFGAAFDLSATHITLGVTATSTVSTTSGGTLDTNGFNITLANSIGEGGNGGLTKAGAGTLTLNAAANYGGATNLTAGTIAYGVSNALPTITDLTMSASTTLDIGSNSATLRGLTWTGAIAITGSAPLNFTGNVLNSGGSYTLMLTNSQPTVFSGDYFQLSESGTARTFTLSSTGTVTINNAIIDGSAAASNFAKTGAGVLELTGANVYGGTTTNTTGTLILSGSNTGGGNTTLTSGMLQLNSNSNGGLASGTLTLTAGTVQAINAPRVISNNVTLTAATFSGTQSLTINGKLTGLTGAARTLTSSISGGTLTLGNVDINTETANARIFTIAGTGNTTINGVVANGNATTANGLTITNTGVTILAGANTYTGNTSVNASATLLVNNITGSGTGSGNVTVSAFAVLGGTGKISGSVTVADIGKISPGSVDSNGESTLGKLSVGTLTANTGSEIFLQIGGATLNDASSVTAYLSNPGSFVVPTAWKTSYTDGVTQHDQLYISNAGSPTVNAMIIVSGSYLNDYNPGYGDVFQLLDWASLGTNNISGTPDFLGNLPDLGESLSWNTSLFSSTGVIFVVPEPDRIMFVFLGLFGLISRRRR